MYKRVTERVEAALLGLEQDMRRQHPEHWHEIGVALPEGGGERGAGGSQHEGEDEAASEAPGVGEEVEGVPLGGGPGAPQ